MIGKVAVVGFRPSSLRAWHSFTFLESCVAGSKRKTSKSLGNFFVKVGVVDTIIIIVVQPTMHRPLVSVHRTVVFCFVSCQPTYGSVLTSPSKGVYQSSSSFGNYTSIKFYRRLLSCDTFWLLVTSLHQPHPSKKKKK